MDTKELLVREPMRPPRPAPEYPAQLTRESFEDTNAGTYITYGDGPGDCHLVHG